MNKKVLVLASASPRRLELLKQLGLSCQVCAVDADESILDGEDPMSYVRRLALEKVRAAARKWQGDETGVFLGADTAVVLNGRIMGKPRDRADGLAMLRALSGQTHEVYTGVALAADREQVRISRSEVTFRAMSDTEIEWYWLTGEPADKAGSYAIQGLAAAFVSDLKGSFSAVMGLPLFEVAELLNDAGLGIVETSVRT